MLTDYHSHLLPGVDDGPEKVSISAQMLDMWKAQGVKRVVATPHFYSHRESPESFLNRRKVSFDALSSGVSSEIRIVSGAEVYLEKGVSELDLMSSLTLGESKYILIELPYGPYKEWVLSEIYQTAYNWGLIPVIAHIERYLQWYGTNDISKILSIQDVVIQINNTALQKRQTLKFALEIIRLGLPVVFGSDAHNTQHRPPDVGSAYKILRSKLKEPELVSLMDLNGHLI